MPARRQERGVSTDQAPLAYTLWGDMIAQLAVRVGVCPLHNARLICALCDVEVTMTDAEEAEIADLLRLDVPPTFMAWPCARCDTPDIALCPACYVDEPEQPHAWLTPDERARLDPLCGGPPATPACLITRTSPDMTHHPMKGGTSHEVRSPKPTG